jgi:hypothetical protein
MSHTPQDVIDLWNEIRGDYFSEIDIPEAWAEDLLDYFGYHHLETHLPSILWQWILKCKRERIHHLADLPYLQNYIWSALTNQQKKALIRKTKAAPDGV